MNDNSLIAYVVKDLESSLKDDGLFVTEYKEEYCELLLTYAFENLNTDGFFGKYMILPDTSEEWEIKHIKWRNAIKMAPYKVKDGLNSNMRLLAEIAMGKRPHGRDDVEINIDLMKQVMFKVYDVNFKEEKDMGELKRRGVENAKKARNKPAQNQLNDKVSAIARCLVSNEKK